MNQALSNQFSRRSNYHWTMWHPIVWPVAVSGLGKGFSYPSMQSCPFQGQLQLSLDLIFLPYPWSSSLGAGSSCLSLPSSYAWGLESSPMELYVTISLWSLFFTFQFSFFLHTESNFHSCWNSPFSGLKRCWISNNINILWGQRYVVGRGKVRKEQQGETCK